MIKFFLNWFNKTPVPTVEQPILATKDPMDWSLTESSTEWETDQYCFNCKRRTTHNNRMSDICDKCGYFGKMSKYRSSRKIWNGEKWVLQRKYGNGPDEFTIE